MKKLLVSALILSMILTFMPSAVFGADDRADETNIRSRETIKVNVSNEAQLREALTGNNHDIEITVIEDIKLNTGIPISGTRNIVLRGDTSDRKISFSDSIGVLGAKEQYAMLYFASDSNISMIIENIVLDGAKKAALFCLGESSANGRNSLTMENGAILQNGYPQLPAGESGNPPSGGAIRLMQDTSFVMNGGKIINNVSDRYGGGIYSWATGINVEINGGKIADNRGGYAGGIALLGAGATLSLQGGTIEKNIGTSISHGGGIFSQDGSLLLLGGSAVVKDNEVVDGTKSDKSDIYFNNDKVEIQIVQPLTGEINFKNQENSNTGNSVTNEITASEGYTLQKSDADHLNFSDKSEVFYLDTAATPNAIRHAKAINITFHANDENIESKSQIQAVPSGINTKLEANPFTRDGYIFAGWNTAADGSGTAYNDEAEINIDTDIELYAQWIEAPEDITLEYRETGTVLPEYDFFDISYSNPNIVTIDEKGNITTVNAGETTVTAKVTTPSGGTAEISFKVTVTAMPIEMKVNDGSNQIKYSFTGGQAPALESLVTFEPAGKTSDQTITLKEGTDIAFEYDAGAGRQEYDYLPINVTDAHGIDVVFNLLNENYTFINEEGEPVNQLEKNIIVTDAGKTESPITGVESADSNLTLYADGEGQAPILDLTGIKADGIDTFTVHFHPWENTEFPETHLEDKTPAELTAEAIKTIAPKKPGKYLMIIDGVGESNYAYQSWVFEIKEKETSGGGGGGIIIPPSNDHVVHNPSSDTTTADIYVSVGADGIAKVTVSESLADKIVASAIRNQAEEVVLDATTYGSRAKAAEVKLPAEAIVKLLSETDAELTVKTDAADLHLDRKAMEQISEKAATGSITFSMEKTKEEAAAIIYLDLHIAAEQDEVADFGTGTAEITVKLPDALYDKEVTAVYIDEKGIYEKIGGVKNDDNTFTFTTDHFSSYAVMETAEADKIIQAQIDEKNARIIKGVQETDIKLAYKMSEIGKGWIKIRWTKEKGYAVDYYEVFRSAKKKSNFGKEAYFTKNSGKINNWYKNTKGIKKGTRYYYKVRGVREIDGKTYYTKWSNTTWRTGR